MLLCYHLRPQNLRSLFLSLKKNRWFTSRFSLKNRHFYHLSYYHLASFKSSNNLNSYPLSSWCHHTLKFCTTNKFVNSASTFCISSRNKLANPKLRYVRFINNFVYFSNCIPDTLLFMLSLPMIILGNGAFFFCNPSNSLISCKKSIFTQQLVNSSLKESFLAALRRVWLRIDNYLKGTIVWAASQSIEAPSKKKR